MSGQIHNQSLIIVTGFPLDNMFLTLSTTYIPVGIHRNDLSAGIFE